MTDASPPPARLGITPGPVRHFPRGGEYECSVVIDQNDKGIAICEDSDEGIANAALIAEAFNVANETGLSPRQLKNAWVDSDTALADAQCDADRLAAERAQLREALENMTAAFQSYDEPDPAIREHDKWLIDQACAVLARTEAGGKDGAG
jgi:hypothetical protein